jgi:RNA-directed DNA polymerase
MQYTEVDNTWYKLSLIAGHAKRDSNMQFTSLAHLLNVEYLEDCFNSLNRNKAKGVDNVSWEDYGRNLKENLEVLFRKLKSGKYKPLPSRRVYIPKGETSTRPIGISALENKIVERGLTWILERIYEEDFLDSSYGFRPKRNGHQALKKIHDLITFQPVNHVVEADIKGFFDNVSHERLMCFLEIRIKDRTILRLIGRFLKAGYIDDGILVETEAGTPQGSILSPLLANIYLHYVLDVWFEKMVKPNVKGYCEIVRYADDFICVVQYEKDAVRIEKGLQNRFNKFGLELHPEKSRHISFGKFERLNSKNQRRKPNTFTFLGITHYCDVTRKGGFKIGRKTCRKKFSAKCKEMNEWLRGIRNVTKTKEWWGTLASKLTGHFQYYGVSENYDSVDRFYRETIRMVRKWMNRRSQKRKMSWAGFAEYLQHYPLPKPKICHDFYMSPDAVS